MSAPTAPAVAAPEGTTADGWSAYDDAVPHVTGLPALTERMGELRALRSGPSGATLADVRDVVVVASSSRGGSTLLGEVLRRTPGLLHLRAEANPLFALAGLHEGPARRRVLEAELLADLGHLPEPGDPPRRGDEVRHRLVLDLAWRLLAQWPTLAERRSLGELLAVAVRRVGRHGDPVAALVGALAELHQVEPGVDLRRYDLPAERVPPRRCRAAAPCGPPGPAVVEMPPFVVPGPWVPATAEDLRTRTLVLATPRSSFRLGFLRDLFPAARLRVLHLVRNPAAAVNGLVDGWRHHGFFTCPVPSPLAIDGYTGEVPAGDRWWCFDVPPEWAAWTDRPLPEVCAHQWTATHLAALAGTAAVGADCHQLAFEDLVGPTERRAPAIAALAEWLGLPTAALAASASADLPVVMATQAPAPGRWRAREAAVLAGLRAVPALPLADALGCGDPAGWR